MYPPGTWVTFPNTYLSRKTSHKKGTLYYSTNITELTIAPDITLVSKLAVLNTLQSKPLDWHLQCTSNITIISIISSPASEL